MRKDRTMDEKDKDKIVELKQKADDKRFHIRGLPSEVGEKNENIRAINRAFYEDERVRKNAQAHAEDYLRNVEDEVSAFPSWMWFVTGCIFVIMLEVFAFNTTTLDYFVKMFYGG